MLRRLMENVLIGAVASAIAWALSNPSDAPDAAGACIHEVLSDVANYGIPLATWLWPAASGLFLLGLLLQVHSMAPQGNAKWRWSVSMPSAPTTLMGLGLGIGLSAGAIGLAAAGSPWAFVLLVLVSQWAYRWAGGIHARWSSMAGLR